jgi:hypothetical protein
VTSTDETANQAGCEVACVLAGAKNFREIGDQAADLPQEVLARLGGTPRRVLRRIVAPSEKRIRTLIQELDAERLDEIIGGWLRGLAGAGRLEPLPRRSRSTGNGCAASATGRSSCSPRCCTRRR